MKVYRVCYYNNSDSSQGFSYHTSKAEAASKLSKFKKQEGENFDSDRSSIDMEDIPIGKIEFLKLLNQWGSHPDNG